MAILQKYVQMLQVSARAGAPAPPTGTPTEKERIDWLYSILTILDTKAGALLAFDGLLLAAASFMYEKMSENMALLKVLALGLILVALLAALLCLLVAQMSYSFLGRITVGTLDNTAEINELERVAEQRTKYLWVAWGVSVGAVLFFMLVVVIKLFS
jgi:hypothetical protein